jgi:large subunit ribosomal protein L15
MTSLSNLKDTSRTRKSRRRVGRGIGSGLGKTSGRGEKGAGSRSGYKRRHGYEGGQVRLFRKLPERGFNNARFRKELDVVNLGQIDRMFADGEVVSVDTLRQKGFLSGPSHGLKVLAKGDLKKKIKGIEAAAVSATARQYLEKIGVPISIL